MPLRLPDFVPPLNGYEGTEVNEADFVHLSPARFKHINPYGRYEFDVAKTFSREDLRPLRNLTIYVI